MLLLAIKTNRLPTIEHRRDATIAIATLRSLADDATGLPNGWRAVAAFYQKLIATAVKLATTFDVANLTSRYGHRKTRRLLPS